MTGFGASIVFTNRRMVIEDVESGEQAPHWATSPRREDVIAVIAVVTEGDNRHPARCHWPLGNRGKAQGMADRLRLIPVIVWLIGRVRMSMSSRSPWRVRRRLSTASTSLALVRLTRVDEAAKPVNS